MVGGRTTAPAGVGPRFGEEAGMGVPAGQKHCHTRPVRCR